MNSSQTGGLAHTISSLFKGINPLWARQIPYTMMKFASFETIVEAIYGYLPKKKSEYNKLVQTEVSFAAGYLGKLWPYTISRLVIY